MLKGSCHCGAIEIEIPSRPQAVTLCNCSICRRVGALWAYFAVGLVTVRGHPQSTESYVWGDRTLRYVRCQHCGCWTHWEPLQAKPGRHMAVNIRNFDPAELGDVRLRRFDGADSWTYLD